MNYVLGNLTDVLPNEKCEQLSSHLLGYRHLTYVSRRGPPVARIVAPPHNHFKSSKYTQKRSTMCPVRDSTFGAHLCARDFDSFRQTFHKAQRLFLYRLRGPYYTARSTYSVESPSQSAGAGPLASRNGSEVLSQNCTTDRPIRTRLLLHE